MTKLSLDNGSLESLFSKLEQSLDDDKDHPIDASAWFLGPKAENAEALLEFVALAASRQIETRKKYMPNDPSMIDDYQDKDHQDSIDIIRSKLTHMLDQLQGSIPLASYRNQSHMYWDITLPGAAGYFAAMLYNQNNVAAEASPVTTLLEIKVGKALCEMLGFMQPLDDNEDAMRPWGHITCDGSVANGESMWAARNLKFLPVALATAIAVEEKLHKARCVSVTTCQGKRGRLIDLSLWELLNLPIDEVIGLTQTIQRDSGIDEKIVNDAVDAYSVQNIGLVHFQQRFLDSYQQATPVVFVPATAHYSWPKTAALLGLGTQAVKPIKVDLDGRMNVRKLRRELCKCLKQGRPVLQVVAVMGSTEEGAIDPLADIVALRKEFQGLGLNFVIHVDGAWGGYFTSMLRSSASLGADLAADIDSYPRLYLNEHFTTHFDALPEVDSVTLDPHKSGFIPYPAGGLCYRNGDMRNLIAFTAPVVTHGGVDPTVGPYGIEGSKPGAAAASVYLTNKVIPLNQDGYGRLLGRCLFNSKRFYAALVTMDLDNERKVKDAGVQIQVTPFQRLPVERQGGSEKQILQQKKNIAETIVPHQTNYLIDKVFGLPNPNKQQAKALKLFQEIGSDLSIVTYAFNFSTASGVNKDLDLMNKLNHEIFRKLSLQPNESGKIPTTEMFVTASNFDPAHYGKKLVKSFAKRAGVVPKKGVAINFLISTTQNPWLSTTADGNVMIPKLIEILGDTAHKIAVDIAREHNLD